MDSYAALSVAAFVACAVDIVRYESWQQEDNLRMVEEEFAGSVVRGGHLHLGGTGCRVVVPGPDCFLIRFFWIA